MSSPLVFGTGDRFRHAINPQRISASDPVPMGTRKTLARHSRAILEARKSAPCSIRVAPATFNRHPPT